MLLGGAALTRRYVERDLREVYEGRVFYGKDAFEGLRTMDRLMEIKRSGDDDPSFGREAAGPGAAVVRDGTARPRRSSRQRVAGGGRRQHQSSSPRSSGHGW